MWAESSETRAAYIYVIEDVISKSRCELVDNGELEESVLSQIQSKWKSKMIQAGAKSGTIERSSASIPTPTPDPNPLPENADNSTLMDIDAQFLRSNPSMDLLIPTKREPDGFCIPKQDGVKDEDIVLEPHTYDARTDVDENEEILNEDDDEEDANDVDETNITDLVLCQFVNVKRPSKTRKKKNMWECTFKAGVMEIDGKSVLFSKATGEFDFSKME